MSLFHPLNSFLSNASLFRRTGTPAAGANVQISDPVSPLLASVFNMLFNTYQLTSLASTAYIMGPTSYDNSVPGNISMSLPGGGSTSSWGVMAAGLNYSYYNTYAHSAQYPMTPASSRSSWALLNPPTPTALQEIIYPPQPCGTGTNCDTDKSVPGTLGLSSTYSDSQTPYTVLDSNQCYTLLTGTVQDATTVQPIPAIPMIVTDSQTPSRFTSFEKITSSATAVGTFNILVPVGNPSTTDGVTLQINPTNATFYNPSYQSASVPGASNFSSCDQTVNLGAISLQEQGSAATTGSTGTITLNGTVKSNDAVSPAPLSGIGVEGYLNGSLVTNQFTNGSGQYSFPGLSAGNYTLHIQAGPTASIVSPPSAAQAGGLFISLTGAQTTVTAPDIQVAGVPGTIKGFSRKYAGQMMVFAKTSSSDYSIPTSLSANSGSISYTTVVDPSGNFVLQVPAGTYWLYCLPLNVPVPANLMTSPASAATPSSITVVAQQTAVGSVSCP